MNKIRQIIGNTSSSGRIKCGEELLKKAKGLEEIAARIPSQESQKLPRTHSSSSPSQVSSIQSTDNYWTITNVNYRNPTDAYQLSKQLLPSKTQDQHAQHAKQAIASNNFYTPDFPLLYNIIETTHNLRDDSTHKDTAEEIRQQLQKWVRAKWLTTLTRIQYTPTGKDKIIHNHGLDDQYEIEQNFIGKNGQIPANSPEQLYKDLLGTKSSVQKISEVIQWLNQTPTYIWRLNSKPKKLTERVAGFVANSDRANFDCSRGPGSRNGSLGVRRVVVASTEGASQSAIQGGSS